MLRLVPLAAAAAFLIGGAITLAVEDNGLGGTTLLAAGLVTLGSWIGIESWSSIEERRRTRDPGGKP